MRPGQVLDMQADLLRRLDSEDPFREFIVNVLAAAHDSSQAVLKARGLDVPIVSEGLSETNARRMRTGLQAGVRAAYAYRVTGDMVSLVEHVALQLDEHDRFDRGMAPTGCGIVRLEQPFRFTDVRGKSLRIHWVVWAPIGVQVGGSRHVVGTAVYFFNDHFDGPDDIALEQNMRFDTDLRHRRDRHIGRWGFIGADVYRDQQDMGPTTNAVTPEMAAKIVAAGDTPHDFTNLVRYVHALWLLMGQTITTVEPEHVERTAAKRAGRAGIPGRVSVIRLRRVESRRGEGESLVEWSHRWLVRAHPRWQPYGDRSGNHLHEYGEQVVTQGHAIRPCAVPGCDARLERIIVRAHIKGPDDKPLVISEKVYDLAR